MEFIFYNDRLKMWRWYCIDDRKWTIGRSHRGFMTEGEARRNAERNGMDGNVNNFGACDEWEFYSDKTFGWRWRRVATNKMVSGSSYKSFASEDSAIENARLFGFKVNEE